ncbi:MAG: pseudouridine-5-phosphate glycosidase, partial [Actinobacteria bacterium]|nr:pseudouridine-5-phosphate glycosidase [Actinomycetota bacterium]
ATGGIGGVHRGAATSFDISADLTEMAVTPVAVVSAGVKSILDIRLTLERLETLGVPVVVNGSDDFPSFYSRTSGLPAPRRLDGPAALARMMWSAWTDLGLSCGISIANPIPVEHEIPAAEIATFIDEALADLDAKGITGQDVTPFLLKRVVEGSGGRSLVANLALVRNNAATAAQVAVEYAILRRVGLR